MKPSNIILKFVIAVFFLLSAQYVKAQVASKKINIVLLQKSAKKVLGTNETITWHAIAIPDSVTKQIRDKRKTSAGRTDSLFVGVIQTDSGKKYVIPDIAPSRSETFSYVLYLNADKKIIGVDVLVYRESYGYEIDYPYFRAQFKGKQKAVEIIFGRTVQNISGATISARSMTHSVHDLLLLVNHLTLP